MVGGIAIVFDGAPQFRAMLRAALPDQAGAAALLATRAGEVVASSDARWSPGDRLPMALPALSTLPSDQHVTGEPGPRWLCPCLWSGDVGRLPGVPSPHAA